MRSFLPLLALLSACSFPQIAARAPYAAGSNGQCDAGEVAVVATPVSPGAKAKAPGVKEAITCVQSGPTVLAFVKETQECGVKLELRPATDAIALAAVQTEASACRAARRSAPKGQKFNRRQPEAEIATAVPQARFFEGANGVVSENPRPSEEVRQDRRERAGG